MRVVGEIGMLTVPSAFRWQHPKGCAGSNPVLGTRKNLQNFGGFSLFVARLSRELALMFFVYVLYSKTFDKYYIGQTKDLEQRIIRHNNRLENFTKKYIPWELKFYLTKSMRSEALQLERKLKNLSRDRLGQFISKYK